MADRAYLDGLRLLARREVSTVQLCARLARRGHEASDIDAAVARLRQEGALDDTRTAHALARTTVRVKRFGPARVRRALAQAGIDSELAEAAIRAAFGEVDPHTLLEEDLARRLRADAPVDDRTAARVYRQLVAHGHEPGAVARALRARRRAAID